MKDAFVLYRSILNGYRYLSLSSDAFRLFVFLNAESDDYGIVDAGHVMYYTRSDISSLYELIDAKCIISLDEQYNIVYICAWEALNRKYDIRYIHPSPYLQLLASRLPNMLITVPNLTSKKDKNDKQVWTRKKSKCTAKDAINRWIQVLTNEENFDDLTILQSSYLDSNVQIGSSINSSHDQQYIYCDQPTTQCSPSSDTACTQRVSSDPLSSLDRISNGDHEHTQRAPDGETPPIQRATDEDTPPIKRVPDEDTPPIQRVPDEDTPPTQRVAMDNSTQTNRMNSNSNEKEIAASLLQKLGISPRSQCGAKILAQCSLLSIMEAVDQARRTGVDGEKFAGTVINILLEETPTQKNKFKCMTCYDTGFIKEQKILNNNGVATALEGDYVLKKCPKCSQTEGGD